MIRRLAIRPGAIGDLVVSLPALQFLRQGADYLEVWCASQNVPLVRFADRVVALPATGIDWIGLPEIEVPPPLASVLANFDEIISWYGANRCEFRRAVAGLPFRFLPALPREHSLLHAADYYMRQVGGSLPALPRLECAGRDEGFIVIHPFSGSPRKNWAIENFRELARRLERRLPVKWCAGPEEELSGAVRIENLYELACWLARARLYVGNDSGISHLAAAAGTRVVALFGPTDPSVWAPRGPCVRVLRRPSLSAVEAACESLALRPRGSC